MSSVCSYGFKRTVFVCTKTEYMGQMTSEQNPHFITTHISMCEGLRHHIVRI